MSSTPASPARPDKNLLRFHDLLNLICHQIKSSSATLDHSQQLLPTTKRFLASQHHRLNKSLIFPSSSPSSSLHVALRSFRVRDKTPTKIITLCFTSQSAKGAFKRLVGNLTKKASDFVSQNLPFSHPRSSLPFSLLASQRERDL